MDPKPWYQSTTIQGLIIKAIACALIFFKVNIPGLEEALSQIVEALFALIGLIMGVWGRFKANGPISIAGKTALAVPLALCAALSLSACATLSSSSVANVSAQIATSEALFRLVKPEKRAAVARQINEIADVAIALSNGQAADLSAFRARLLAIAKGDPAALLVADLFVAYYAEHYAEIYAQNPGTIAGIRAIATGAKAGAAYYLDQIPIVPSARTPSGAELQRRTASGSADPDKAEPEALSTESGHCGGASVPFNGERPQQNSLSPARAASGCASSEAGRLLTA